MGCFTRIVARLFFVVLFIGAGVNKVSDPAGPAGYLSGSYKIFHEWVQNTQTFQKAVAFVPTEQKGHLTPVIDLLTPAFVSDNSLLIIKSVGVFQIVCSALVLLGVPLAGFGLYAFTILATAIFHNPLINPLTFHVEFVNALLNLAVAGVALFIASNISPQAENGDKQCSSTGCFHTPSGEPAVKKAPKQPQTAPKQPSVAKANSNKKK